jgi:hypothetical protein
MPYSTTTAPARFLLLGDSHASPPWIGVKDRVGVGSVPGRRVRPDLKWLMTNSTPSGVTSRRFGA